MDSISIIINDCYLLRKGQNGDRNSYELEGSFSLQLVFFLTLAYVLHANV